MMILSKRTKNEVKFMTEYQKISALKIYPTGLVAKIELPNAEYQFQRMQLAVSNDCRDIDIKDILDSLELKEYCLIFDDEFLLKGKAILNPIASYLYGYQEHGQPLCGNVLVMKNYFTPEEEIDTVGLSDEDVNIIQNFIARNLDKIRQAMYDFLKKV